MKMTAPPRPSLGLCVGITGHRELPGRSLVPLQMLVGSLLREIADAVHGVGKAHPAMFADTNPDMVLLSQCARGADQLVARVAADHGYQLRAVLPFARAIYAQDFTQGAERAQFEALLDSARALWELPNGRDAEDKAYALAGEATIAQCDLVLAIWDGKASRGPGGTADVVDYAVRRGVPVIHIPIDQALPPQLLWSGIDGLPPSLLHRDSVPQQAIEPADISRIVANLLTPPENVDELAAITAYFQERERRWRWRLEYPLLLAMSGIRRLQIPQLHAPVYANAVRSDWAAFRAAPEYAVGHAAAGLDRLQNAFGWSDGLADHYAQTYRSGAVFNFLAGALAVILAVFGLVFPAGKFWLLAGELLLIAGVVANTNIGNRHEWHRRWLDYRFLAEQLRPMRSLKLLGAATPLSSVHPSAAGWARWTDWYAAALWREMGAPPSLANAEILHNACAHIAQAEVAPQITYHRANARRMHLLDHRLHIFGTALFMITVAGGLLTLVAVLTHAQFMAPMKTLLGVMSAVLPTLGTAVFGIRGQGDFAGAARRSAETAGALQRAFDRLMAPPIDLPSAARATEDASVTMLADLGAWRTSYRDRKLAIPS